MRPLGERDDAADDRDVERLQHVMVEAGLQRVRAVLTLAEARHRGKVHPGAGRQPAQLAGDLVAADVGEPDVDDREVEVPRARLDERLAAGRHRHALVTEQSDDHRERMRGVRMVVDNQDSMCGRWIRHGMSFLRSACGGKGPGRSRHALHEDHEWGAIIMRESCPRHHQGGAAVRASRRPGIWTWCDRRASMGPGLSGAPEGRTGACSWQRVLHSARSGGLQHAP